VVKLQGKLSLITISIRTLSWSARIDSPRTRDKQHPHSGPRLVAWILGHNRVHHAAKQAFARNLAQIVTNESYGPTPGLRR